MLDCQGYMPKGCPGKIGINFEFYDILNKMADPRVETGHFVGCVGMAIL